jgi:hypothetical protein
MASAFTLELKACAIAKASDETPSAAGVPIGCRKYSRTSPRKIASSTAATSTARPRPIATAVAATGKGDTPRTVSQPAASSTAKITVTRSQPNKAPTPPCASHRRHIVGSCQAGRGRGRCPTGGFSALILASRAGPRWARHPGPPAPSILPALAQ